MKNQIKLIMILSGLIAYSLILCVPAFMFGRYTVKRPIFGKTAIATDTIYIPLQVSQILADSIKATVIPQITYVKIPKPYAIHDTLHDTLIAMTNNLNCWTGIHRFNYGGKAMWELCSICLPETIPGDAIMSMSLDSIPIIKTIQIDSMYVSHYWRNLIYGTIAVLLAGTAGYGIGKLTK